MLVLFSLLIFGQALLAQKFNGFYFEPLINVKTTILYKNDFSEPINTPYFSLKPMKRITPLGFNIGINFGYKFKNNSVLQIGVFQDESLSGLSFSGNELSSGAVSATIGSIKYSHYGGVMIKNINCLFKKELFHVITNKSNREPYVSAYFNIGLTYFYKPNNGLENLTGIDGAAYYSIDSNYVQFTEGVWVFPRPPLYSFKINFGIEITFGTKKNELFNLGVSYITNFSENDFSFSSAEVRVTDKNNKTISYPFYVKARGNGIYYQISRRFYPFKWYNLRQQKKLEEYKKANG